MHNFCKKYYLVYLIIMTTLESEVVNKTVDLMKQIMGNDFVFHLVEKSIEFVIKFIGKNKLDSYSNEIRKIIMIEKGSHDSNGVIDSIEILSSVKTILKNLYGHFEVIKHNELSKSERKFVKQNINVISQIVLILSIYNLDEDSLIEDKILINILTFIRTVNTLNIDMKVKKTFMSGCVLN